MEHRFSRMEMLVGIQSLQKLKDSKVAVFGIGGVGSFAVEGLVRGGVGNLVLVDMDDVSVSNINRQIHATEKTIHRPKVEVMKERILDINPEAVVEIHKMLYNHESGEALLHEEYSYVVDAIDMVSAKIDLIVRCKEKNIPVISCMGTGNKLNPTMLEVGDLYSTSVCPLAKVMRRELKRRGIEKLKVVYSKECPLKPQSLWEEQPMAEEKKAAGFKRQTPGSVSFVPSVAGLIIASEVIKDLLKD